MQTESSTLLEAFLQTKYFIMQTFIHFYTYVIYIYMHMLNVKSRSFLLNASPCPLTSVSTQGRQLKEHQTKRWVITFPIDLFVISEISRQINMQ